MAVLIHFKLNYFGDVIYARTLPYLNGDYYTVRLFPLSRNNVVVVYQPGNHELTYNSMYYFNNGLLYHCMLPFPKRKMYVKVLIQQAVDTMIFPSFNSGSEPVEMGPWFEDRWRVNVSYSGNFQ